MPLNFKPFANSAKVSIEKNVIHVPDDPVELQEPDIGRREPSRGDETCDPRIKALEVEQLDVEAFQVNPRNAKLHPPKQIDKLQKSYEQYGFIQPIIVDEKNVV